MSTLTEIYGLFGNPVAHSLSPLMHNRAFRKMKLNALYVPFLVEDLEGAIRGIRALNIRGVSVTIPFKATVLPYLDDVEESARAIGAVNTIMNTDGTLKGYNTDWIGLVHSLGESVEIRGRTFAVIGAGGAARAAVFGILKKGGVPIIMNRTAEKGETLAREFGCPFQPLTDIPAVEAEGLINTTPVGMTPDEGKTPIRRGDLSRFRVVMDVIYNPLRTRLLREAGEAGCHVVNGLGMFIHQGAEQIRIWTGQEPPVALMRQVVRKQLENKKKGFEDSRIQGFKGKTV
jgi:shikimate dehydrogenase